MKSLHKSSFSFQALHCTYRKNFTELTKIKRKISYAYHLGFKIVCFQMIYEKRKKFRSFSNKVFFGTFIFENKSKKKPCFRNWARDIGMTSWISGVSPIVPTTKWISENMVQMAGEESDLGGFLPLNMTWKILQETCFPVVLLRQIPDSRGPNRLCSVWRCAWFAEISILWSSSSLEQEVFPPSSRRIQRLMSCCMSYKKTQFMRCITWGQRDVTYPSPQWPVSKP